MAALLTTPVLATAAESAVPRERVISFWSGAANAGTGRRLDEVGSNHLFDGSVHAVAPGKIGVATDFSGSAIMRTKLSTNTNASSVHSEGRDISYAGWIRLDSVATSHTIAARWSNWSPGCEHRLYFDATSGVVKLEWANFENTARRTVADTLVMTSNQWYFVAYGRSDADAESWLCVTPDSSATPRPRVALGTVPTNARAHSTALSFGNHDGGTSSMDGLWNQWGVYSGTLSAAEIAWLFHAGAGRALADFAYVEAPAMGYFHDFEQEDHLSGRISYQQYYGNVARSTEQAKAGTNSLKVFGSWGQIQVYNNSNTDYWCTTEECKVSMDLYVTEFVGSSMLFQMDGKTSTILTDLDTNEGLGVMFYLENGRRGFSFGATRTSGYDLPLNQWVHLTYLRKRSALAPDYTTALYANGVLILSTTGPSTPVALTPYVAKAWHHISVGNDRLEAPTFYLDNFSVRPLARLQDPPDILAMPDRVAMVGTAIDLEATAYDVDGDPLTFTWSKISGPGVVSFANPNSEDTAVTFSTAGNYVLQLSASDGGRSTTRQLAVTVSNGAGNTAPMISAGAASVMLATMEDEPGNVVVTGSDADGDMLSWDIQVQGALGSAAVTASGSPVTVTYTPDVHADGTDTVLVRVSDGQGGTDTITVMVTITPVNDAPRLLLPMADQTAFADSAYNLVLPSGMATDDDGDALAWSVTGLPAWLAFESATRTFSGTPTVTQVGASLVTITISDGTLSVSDVIMISVVSSTTGADGVAASAGDDDPSCGMGSGVAALAFVLMCMPLRRSCRSRPRFQP